MLFAQQQNGPHLSLCEPRSVIQISLSEASCSGPEYQRIISLLFKVCCQEAHNTTHKQHSTLPPDNLNFKTGFELLLPPQTNSKPGPR